MKRLTLLVTLFAIFFYSCQDDDPVALQDIQFTIGIDAVSAGGRSATYFPDNAAVLLTVKDANGTAILSNTKVAIRKMGDSYITDPVRLSPGQYTLTDFMIVNEDEEVLYATPQKGSKLAAIVSRSLPYSFSVSRNDVRNIGIEVVQAHTHQPEDFGYASFNIGIAYPLQVAVFAEQPGGMELTQAVLYLRQNGEARYTYNLGAKVNLLSFKGDPDETFTLVIAKDGHKNYTREFTYNQLQTELNGGPLEVILQKNEELAVTILPGGENFSMWMEVAEKGTLTLDWGNGETELLEFDVDPEEMTATAYFYRDRQYSGTILPIRLTGDLHLLRAFWLETAISALDVGYARGLTGIAINESHIETLNLSVNSDLQWFGLTTSTITNLTLPQQHAIREIVLEGSMPSAQMDYIVSNIHMNTVAGNFTNGMFLSSGNAISDESLVKLGEMRDSYEWEVQY